MAQKVAREFDIGQEAERLGLILTAALGGKTVPIRPDVPDMAVINAMMQLIMAAEAATIHRKWLIERPDDYAQQVRSRIEPGLIYPATRYIEALESAACTGLAMSAAERCRQHR